METATADRTNLTKKKKDGVEFKAAARAILWEDGKDPSLDLGPPVHSWGFGLGPNSQSHGKRPLKGPPVDNWGSWSGTKQ
jgi:hypothetical protein